VETYFRTRHYQSIIFLAKSCFFTANHHSEKTKVAPLRKCPHESTASVTIITNSRRINPVSLVTFLKQLKLDKMKKNMGNIDRGIRVIVAIVIAALYFTGTLTGTLGIILLVLAGVFVLTSFVSFCPLYTLIGASTCPVEKTEG